MAVGVLMPKAGITVETCMITKWEKKVGDAVEVGDILFSYETDKAAFECESTADGVLLAIFFDEGDEVPVLTNVCAVGAEGEDFSSLLPDTGDSAEKPADDNAVRNVPVDESSDSPAPVTYSAEEIKISPRARNLAERMGIDAASANPSGPYGRILERDILKAAEKRFGTQPDKDGFVAAAPADSAEPGYFSGGEYTDIPFNKIRAAIAQAMSASLSSGAQLSAHHSFDASAILELRKKIKENTERVPFYNITINDLILYAVSRVLLNHPDLNAHIVEGQILRRFKDVNLGVAVDTPRGLMVPTIFQANRKSIEEISVEAKDLAKQAQAGTINPDLLQGGTFTVTNLGTLGVEMFTPVLNPPQTGILGVCNITAKLKGNDGFYKPYPAMGLSITYDHRAVDGAPAARFMQELTSFLENFSNLPDNK